MIFKLSANLEFIKPFLNYIGIIIFLLFQFLIKRWFNIKNLKISIIVFSFLNIVFALSFSVMNYLVWTKDVISKQLLPPYAPFSYILHYSWQHYFFAPIVTILFALIVLWGIKKLNKKFNETFFYDEEPYLAALGILTTGWPNCLFYLSLVLLLGMISHCIVFLINFLNYKRRRGEVAEKTIAQAERAWFLNKVKKSEAERERSDLAGVGHRVFSKQPSEPLRLSLFYFWLPCALLTLLLSDIINKYLIINQLVI